MQTSVRPMRWPRFSRNDLEMQQAKLFETDGLLAGVDEAGRGPLAGPVVASAVVLDPHAPISGLADSKKLTAKRRDALAIEIRQHALAWSVAWADSTEIDAINILAATMLAMRRAVQGLVVTPTRVLVDGNRLPDLCFESVTIQGEAIIGGDDIVPAISAASIIAKTTRDQMMVELDRIYPNYEFARHKGYGTKIHLDRLNEFGPCCEHRHSFAPVRAAS
jgi:ribonuclease HII